MKKYINYKITVLLCLSVFHINAQNDLKKYQEKYPDKNGVFLKLHQNVIITIDKEGKPKVDVDYDEERIFLNDNYKFYTEESIGFSSFTQVSDVTPTVLVPKDDKYKKIKITNIVEEDDRSDNVFHDDLKKKKFLYNGLVKGSKTTLKYHKEILEPYFFGSFYFSSYLPVESSQYTVTTPADMEISYTLFGKEKDKVSYTVETVGKQKIHSWKANDMEEFNLEPGSVDIRYFATHLQLRIHSYDYKNERKNILRNVDDLYAYYMNFINQMESVPSTELEELADSITQGKKTPVEKVKAILYWVQDNIKYVAFEDGMGGFVPRPAVSVYDRKYGDCKDMSSILHKMINSVGVPAYFTWVGSRDIPYKYNDVPTPVTDNHMICSFHDGEKYVFLDATGKGLIYGMPTSFIQNKEALIAINDSTYELVTIPTPESHDCLTADSVYVTIEDGVVKGKGTVTYTGYSSCYLTPFINNMTKEQKEEFFESAFQKGNNKCTSSVSQMRGNEKRETNLEIDYSFDIPDYVKEYGDELFFNPFLKKYLSGDEIDVETNKIAKEATYKETNRNLVYVTVPEGYTVDYVPENMKYEHPKFSCEISFKKLEEKNQIEIQTYFVYDYLIIEPEEFEAWNEMIKKINESYSELIIFKKTK